MRIRDRAKRVQQESGTAAVKVQRSRELREMQEAQRRIAHNRERKRQELITGPEMVGKTGVKHSLVLNSILEKWQLPKAVYYITKKDAFYTTRWKADVLIGHVVALEGEYREVRDNAIEVSAKNILERILYTGSLKDTYLASIDDSKTKPFHEIISIILAAYPKGATSEYSTMKTPSYLKSNHPLWSMSVVDFIREHQDVTVLHADLPTHSLLELIDSLAQQLGMERFLIVIPDRSFNYTIRIWHDVLRFSIFQEFINDDYDTTVTRTLRLLATILNHVKDALSE
jgi:hypothetical protein